jgi:hypothetical protein
MSAYIGNAPGVGQDQLYVFFPAAGATTLSGADARGISLGYTIGEPFVEVQVNGVILAPGDYTATTGNTIVLASGSFEAGDVVVVRARSALSLANTYTQTAADALLATRDAAIALKADIPSAWTAYTPVATSSTGTITTVSAVGRYKKIGSVCHFSVTVTITTNGTGGGAVNVTLPVTQSGASAVFAGRENAVAGKMLQGIGNGTFMSVFDYVNGYPGVNGAQLIINGTYEVAP